MTAWDSLSGAKQIEALYRQHAPAVYRFALRGLEGDTEKAKDVVQDVFLVVCAEYESRFHNTSEDRQTRLIMTIARRRVIDCWRGVTRSRETPHGAIADLDLPHDEWSEFRLVAERSDRITEDAQLKRFWETLTRDLTRTEYRVALMTWEMGLSTEEIARTLRTTPGAVITHRSRARRKIDTALQHHRRREGGATA